MSSGRSDTEDMETGPHTALDVSVRDLRALGARHGLRPEATSAVDQAASVVAARVWCSILDAHTFDYPIAHGEGAVRTLAAILARACGRGGRVHVGVSLDVGKVRDLFDAQAVEMTDVQRGQVLARAATDLWAGHDTRFQRVLVTPPPLTMPAVAGCLEGTQDLVPPARSVPTA